MHRETNLSLKTADVVSGVGPVRRNNPDEATGQTESLTGFQEQTQVFRGDKQSYSTGSHLVGLGES